MTESWKRLEGQVVDGIFPLQQYLGGAEGQGVFLTSYGEPEAHPTAIKLIPEDPRGSNRQLQQWRLSEKLSHPHLLRLLASGRCQLENMPLLYVVMEYAEENLSQVIPHRPLTGAEARDMLDPALGALSYVHSEGFVHSHLTPANILAVDGVLRISSDRLCLSGEHSSNKLDAYAPPEIGVDGYSPAGDVWSLGITLVEALTQRRPVAGVAESGELTVPETLPDPFLEIARKCLQRDPRSRWTVDEIRQRLRQSPGVPQESKPVEKPGTSSHWLIYTLSAVLALVLLAIVFGPRLLNRSDGPAEAEVVQPKPQPAADTSPEVAAPRPRPKVEASSPGRGLSRGSATSASEPASGQIVQRVIPEALPKARNSIQGRVRVGVKVRVDASGKVADAQLDSRGPSQYFAQLALEAARRWKFARADGEARRVWKLEFEFLRTGTKVSATRQRN